MQHETRVRASSAARHRARPSSGKEPISRLPTAAQPHTHHWRSSAGGDAPARPKVISAWEFSSGDARSAQIAALNAKLPIYGPSGPVITSYGAAAAGAPRSSSGAAGAQPYAASRPSSAAVLRASQPPYRTGGTGSFSSTAAGTAAQAATKPPAGYFLSAHAAALAATASAASHASAASTTRVGGYSAGGTRPASAAAMRSIEHSGAAPVALLRPASAATRFGVAAAGGAGAGGGAAPDRHRAGCGGQPAQYALVPPPTRPMPPPHAAAPDDGTLGAQSRRALAQPAWSVTELQIRSQYAGTIADDVQRHFHFGRQLGSGSFGEVREATHRLTDGPVAIKKIDKLKAATARLRTRIAMEVRLHQRLRHPNIVHLYEVIEGARNVYLVMELLPTTLLALLKERKVLPEAEARPLFAQLLSALSHCHRNSIVHRDIKLENLLLDESRSQLKLCDFGFAVMTRTHKLTVACGSPSYNCPEIVAKRQYHGVPADVWSSGILLYVMLVGAFPFTGSTHESLNRRILAGAYRVPPDLSAGAQDLIRRCLQVDPDRRATVAEMADHPWMRAGAGAPAGTPRHALRADTTEQEVAAALETLGLGRSDARVAIEQLRRGERSHLTTAYELIVARGRRRNAPVAHAHAHAHAQRAGGALSAAHAAGAARPVSSAGSIGAASARHGTAPATAACTSTHTDETLVRRLSAPGAALATGTASAAAAEPRAAQRPQPAHALAHAQPVEPQQQPTEGPAIGPLRATAVKPQLAVAGTAHGALRPTSAAAALRTPAHALVGALTAPPSASAEPRLTDVVG